MTQTQSDTATWRPRWSGARRWLSLGVLAAASVLIVACDGDDDGDSLDDLNGDASPTVTATSTDTETATSTPEGTAEGTDTASPTATTDGGGAGGPIAVEMIDIAYSETAITARAGEEITLEFDNTGALEHTFTIDDIEAEGIPEEYSSDSWDIDVFLQAGQTATLTFTPSEAGEYEFYCTIPGHEEAGMVGTLTVQ